MAHLESLAVMRVLLAISLVAVFAFGCARRQAHSSPSHCPKCGANLFFAVPGVTTKEDIQEFAAHSKLPDKDQIVSSGWIHPGAYCSNGCYKVHYTFKRE